MRLLTIGCHKNLINLLEGLLLRLLSDEHGRIRSIETTDRDSVWWGLLRSYFLLRLAFHLFLILT